MLVGLQVAPSSLYGAACVLEGVPFINGAPQNTLVPGLIDLAIEHNVLVGGDDFKSGQTKLKSVLVSAPFSAISACYLDSMHSRMKHGLQICQGYPVCLL